jgi:hypothetical protein
MMNRVVSSSSVSAMLLFSAVTYAQTPNPTAGQAGSSATVPAQQAVERPAATEQQITLVGCVQREAEFRQAAGSGRGGVLGSGVGVGNEFVLINVTPGPSAEQTAMSGPSGATAGPVTSGTGTTATGTATTPTGVGTTGSTATGAAGTAGTATPPTTSRPAASAPAASPSSALTMSHAGKAYALTGSREKDLEQHVGQRVEIVGKIEGSAQPGASGTAGSTSSGTTGASGTIAESAGQRVGDLQRVDIVSFRMIGSCSPQ